jgi:hypothetical protein
LLADEPAWNAVADEDDHARQQERDTQRDERELRWKQLDESRDGHEADGEPDGPFQDSAEQQDANSEQQFHRRERHVGDGECSDDANAGEHVTCVRWRES